MKFNHYYLLPNLVTGVGLFCGFVAIIAAFNNHYFLSVYSIVAAMLSDGLDGPVARYTRTETQFGKEFDSLADMVSFGVSPALIAYIWGFNKVSSLGVVISFYYLVTVAIRLAKFNSEVQSKGFFSGLPSPASAATLVSTIWFAEYYGISGSITYIFTGIISILVSSLMVAKIPFFSMKEVNLKKLNTPQNIITIVIFLFLFLLQPALFFMLFFFSYITVSLLDFFNIISINNLLAKIQNDK